MSATLRRSFRLPALAHPRLARVLVPGTLALLVGLSAWVIAAHPQQPVWDQQALLASRIGGPAAPAPATGFTSQLIVALLQPLLPDAPAARDAALRTLAMVLYLGSAAWLAARLLARRASAVVLLLLVTTSQYPFLWLSSELFTGALLMAALAAWASAAPPALAGALLALFGLCKPDAILPALALLAYWAARAPDRREALRLAGAFAGTLLLLLLPGTLTAGLGYFTTYGGAGGRTFASFGQHYAALAAGFQVGETVPNPWTETGAYVSRHFPGATGLGDVVLGHFPRYAEFVALACVRGLFRAGYVANYAALAVPILLFAGWRARLGWGDRERALLLAFVGVAPFVLFAYPHVRYLARYYPLFVLLLLLFMERLGTSRDAVRRPALLAAGACLACSLVENALRLAAALARGAQTAVYWFPD